ncbi:staygreen family protein [Sedimentibacter sp. MB31-C6]|uniref:staygreen family protein n=1 Tax=Sedimentibacter sp. MB31-C6 TaxID=3109366 RepID=UPI002DDD56A6|nr:staygreen family protein [Sedimentibacter sp. MB36-C1]WSI04669.1 staygreen family protein [Sedimentibacter sp. MB36-C1]
MSRLNPEKLYVEFTDVTATEPIIPRRYTLTHSDITADLFLTIGSDFAYYKLNPMRDEVMGEWMEDDANGNAFYVYLYVDGQFVPEIKAIREAIFRKELPLALEAIRYGDNDFFNAHPNLNYIPIIVYFLSTDPMFYKIENWGTFSDYIINVS